MIEIEEENILIEGKRESYTFSFDHNSRGLYIDKYDKKRGELEHHVIQDPKTMQQIHLKISKPPGTLITLNKKKYLVRNHDKVFWSDDKELATHLTNNSQNNPYDTRFEGDMGFIQILKQMWIKI